MTMSSSSLQNSDGSDGQSATPTVPTMQPLHSNNNSSSQQSSLLLEDNFQFYQTWSPDTLEAIDYINIFSGSNRNLEALI